MATTLPSPRLEAEYEEAAQAYLRRLPPEHFMEATGQAMQRDITVQSMRVLKLRRPDVQIFSELLVQYPRPRHRPCGQVVPDNMVVLAEEPVRAQLSFNVPLEPAPPFFVMDYVSKLNKRKDYKDHFKQYEHGLKVPYYLVFWPDTQDKELTLYRHDGRRYVSALPNADGRFVIPEIDLELGLRDGWVRYWHKGELLLLASELQLALEEARRALEAARRRADEYTKRAKEATERIALQKARAEQEKARAEQTEREIARLAEENEPVRLLLEKLLREKKNGR